MDIFKKKARFLKKFVTGKIIYDFGSDEGLLHKNLKNIIPSIKSVDLHGSPDITQDFNKKLSFNDASIDTIIVSEVIEHLNCPLDFLKECERVIKKGGRVILTTPNALSLEEFRGDFGTDINQKLSGDYAGHIYLWKRSGLVALIGLTGLKIKKFGYMDFHWRRNFIFILISKFFDFFKPKLFFVLEK